MAKMVHFIDARDLLVELVLVIIAQFHSHAMLYSDGAIPKRAKLSLLADRFSSPIRKVDRLVHVPMHANILLYK